MKILLLTPISPIESHEVVTRAMNRFNETVNLIPLPYFADVSCRTYDQDYIPAYFSILKATRKPDMHRKLFKGRDVLVIGNTYKNEKFDMIIACQDTKEEVFDKYIEMI